MALVPLALVAGLIYALILYRKNRIEDMSDRQHVLLFCLRFLSVSAIAFLLFNPMIKQLKSSVEKPVIVLAHDNTLSISSTKDSAFYINQWVDQWERFTGSFEEDYNVRSLLFGDEVSEGVTPSYESFYTDLSELGNDLTRRFSGRNVAAVVLATDGIINRGIDPAWSYHLDAPLYTIGLGDTTAFKDRYIHNIFTNEITYLGNSFPLEVEVGAELSNGESFNVSVYKNGRRVESRRITVGADQFFSTLSFTLPAEKPGLQRYSVRINAHENEVNVKNNVSDFYIRVLDDRKRVALLSSFMSPDISALMQSVSTLNSYSTDYFDLSLSAEFFPEEYDIIILYGMPKDKSLREKIHDSGLPAFFIFTQNDDVEYFNDFNAGIKISPQADDDNLVYPVVNKDFNAFSLPAGLDEVCEIYSPLIVPFAEFEAAAGVSTLLFQKIGSVPTDMPLLSLSRTLDTRYCMLLGDGFWKWRLINRKEYGNSDIFDQLISGAMQYLSVQDERAFLYVKCAEQFFENENVLFTAEVYDDNYELNTNQEVSLTIISESGDRFPFTMVRHEKGYSLDAGALLPGQYTYSAVVQHQQGPVTVSGAFVVSGVVAELNDLVADHNLLRRLSARNNGEIFFPETLSDLQKKLQSENIAKPVVSTREILKALVNDIRIFILIILLLTIEWFLRRFAGSY